MKREMFLITPYKNREINFGNPVKVYRNLTVKSGKVYSIQQDGLVVGHATALALYDVKFTVSKSSRERVLRERQRNVHAYAIGKIITEPGNTNPLDLEGEGISLPWLVTYNPFVHHKFIASSKDNLANYFYIDKADYVVFNQLGVSALSL
jgi:hypothetical protein